MHMRTKIIMAASAATIFLGAAAGAVAHRSDRSAGMQERGDMMFDRLDTNKDGKITRAEADAYRDQQFVEFDANKDGDLNLAEYTAMVNAIMAERIQRRFERQDSDNNGSLNKHELSDRLTRMFDYMDRNGDGAVERDEVRRGRHGHDRDQTPGQYHEQSDKDKT